MMISKNKKLLVLGGVQPACELVKEVKKLGLTVYVTDYLEDSPAKKFADKSFMVSTTDVDGVVDLCQREQIDGIVTGYIDSILPYVCQMSERLGVPFWGNKENIELCINKVLFKKACEEAKIPVVPWTRVTSTSDLTKLPDIEFPIVIKPVDNSGSRGVFKCYLPEDYINICKKSLAYSKKKELLIEKMMNHTKEFSVYYMLVDGEAYLACMGDRYVNIIDSNVAPIGQGMYHPSRYLQEWIDNVDSLIKDFFNAHQMKDGVVFIQGFRENEQFFIHEIGYRLNGGFTYKFIEKYSSYNQIHLLSEYALNGTVDKSSLVKNNPAFTGAAFTLSISLKQGTIKEINGIEKIKEFSNVLEFYQLHYQGDTLDSLGTTAQVFAYILCIASNRDELIYTINEIKKNLVVNDLSGNSLLLDIIDPNTIYFSNI